MLYTCLYSFVLDFVEKRVNDNRHSYVMHVYMYIYFTDNNKKCIIFRTSVRCDNGKTKRVDFTGENFYSFIPLAQ